MQVHIFRGQGRIFAFTADAEGANLPAQYGAWTAVKSLQMTEGEAQAGVDVDECLRDIEAHGLHVTDAHIRITEQAVL